MRKIKLIIALSIITALTVVFQGCTKKANPLTEIINPVLPQSDIYTLEVSPSTVILSRSQRGKFDVILVRQSGISHRFAIFLKDENGNSPWWFQPVYVYVENAVRRTLRIKASYSQVKSGLYTAKAEAVDAHAGSLVLEKQINIVKKEEHLVTPPVAVLNYSPATVYTGQDVVFDGSSSYDEDGYIRTFKWKVDGQWVKWGAGITSIIWKFSTSGYHTVVLEVVDNDGAFGTAAVLVDVQNP